MKSFRLFLLVLLTLPGCFAGGGAPGSSPVGGGLVPTGSMDGSVGEDGRMFVGEKAGGAEVPSTGDPTAGNETPMTIVGSPMGSSTKPKDCDERGFRICFHDVTVTAVGAGAADGQLSYDLTGFLAKQAEPGAEVELLPRRDVIVTDVLFPLNKALTTTGKLDPAFTALIASAPGRALRLEATFCHRYTVLEVTMPEGASSPLVVDVCASPDETDIYVPPPPPPNRGEAAEGLLEQLPVRVRR